MKYTFYLIIILLAISVKTSFAQTRSIEIITEPPFITCENGSFTFEVEGNDTYEYQWQLYNSDLYKFENIEDIENTISGATTHKLELLVCSSDMHKNVFRCGRKRPNKNWEYTGDSDAILAVIEQLSDPEGTIIDPESICPLSLPVTITLETDEVNKDGKVVWYLEEEGDPIGEGTTIEYELVSNEVSKFYVRWELQGCSSDFESVSLIIENPVTTSLSYSVDSIPAKDTSYIPVIDPDISGKKFSVEPEGLYVDVTSGQLILNDNTEPGLYTIFFTINGDDNCYETSSTEIEIYISPEFSYDSDEFCKNGPNPKPKITGTGGGDFSSSNLKPKQFKKNTGELFLDKIENGEYDITYTIEGIFSTVNITIKDFPAAPDSISSSVESYCYNSKPDTIRLLLHGGGDGNSTLFWYQDSINNEVFSGNTELIVTGDNIPDETTKVFARWTNDCGDSQSDSITIVVSHDAELKEIEVEGGNIFCKSGIHGKDITFNIKDNNPEDSIIVYKYINETTVDTISSGYNQKSITIPGDKISTDTTIFYAKWINNCGESADSTKVAIYLDDIWFNKNLEKPIDSICNLSSWDFKIEAENLLNSELRYQWYKNDKKIPGQKKDSLSLDIVTANDNGTYYCEVKTKDDVCTIESSSTELKVVELETRILTKGVNEEYEIRDSVPVLLVGSNPGLSYQWYFKGVGDYDYDTIHGANQQYYYPSNYLFKDGKFSAGTYRLEASDTTNNLRCLVIDEYDIELPSTTKSIIVVYPNPNRGNSTINIPGNPSLEFHDEGTLRIWNLMGALEREVPLIRQVDPLSISIRNLSSGMYMLEVQFKNGDHYTDKIIVQ